jgi:hypothetical protein
MATAPYRGLLPAADSAVHEELGRDARGAVSHEL